MTQEPAQPSGAPSPPDGVGIAASAETASVGNPTGEFAVDAAGVAVATDTIAVVQGEPVTQLPQDLYIPPDALEVILETFEGPLDLLLYLIKRQNLDILNIPIADITAQYMEYIALMETMRLELAAEYLLMAAMLAEIKSRMLLPRVGTGEDDEDDPRAELIRRLQEYEQFKEAAQKLEALPRVERELHPSSSVEAPEIDRDIPLPDVTLRELLLALKDVSLRSHANEHHHINREALSVRERMTHILSVLQIGEFCEFSTCFVPEEGRLGVVVTFLAILELCKEASIDIVQSAPFAPIYLKARTSSLESDLDAAPEAAPEVSGTESDLSNEASGAASEDDPDNSSANLEDDTWH